MKGEAGVSTPRRPSALRFTLHASLFTQFIPGARSCTTTSSSSAPAPAAARSPTGWRPRASGSCCSSGATTSRGRRTTGARARSTSRAGTRPRRTGATSDGKRAPPAHQLLGRRQHQVLRRGAVPAPSEEDFGELQAPRRRSRRPGRSRYDDLEPYYTEAEHLYQVHGERGEDPTEPPASAAVPLPGGEPRAAHPAAAATTWPALGCKPFHVPLGIMLDEQRPAQQPLHPLRHLRRLSLPGVRPSRTRRWSAWIRRSQHPNVTLLTGAYVSRLETSASGREVTRVLVERDGDARVATPPTSSSSPAARSTPRRCCCARRATGTPAAWPTAPTWSAGTTWATSTRC